MLAVEELHLAKQGSMTSEEFYSQVLEIVKRCQFPNQEAEERAIRDAIFIGMNSQWARDKAINLMNEEEGKEVTVEFLMNHLAVEDGNTQHRFLSQLNSSSSVNMVAYDHRQNRGKSNRSKNSSGKEREQNKTRVQTSSSTAQPSRKPPSIEGKCMRCGKPEHQQGEKCAAKNAKCKDCHKIGHFYKVCQSSKRTRRANLAQVTPQDEDDTHIDECGYTQPNPPVVNMLKVINHTGTTSGTQRLKFPIDVDPRGPYKHHLEVSIDTGADVNCMNEKTFRRLFPKVELSVCPHSIQNFGNSTADIYTLGQFCTYLQFRGRKYLNTFIVTNANDCPNILSHGATFRMGVLVPNYPEENVVKQGDQETGTSNVFQILQDLQIKQYQGKSESKAHQPSTTFMTGTTKQLKVLKTHETTSQKAGMANMSQIPTPCRTMPPPKIKTNTSHSTRQSTQEIHQNSSHSRPPTCCMHAHQLQSQICKTGKLPALREVKHPHKGRTSVSRFPLAKQGISSQDSSYFEGIGHFTRDPCKFHLKSDLQQVRHESEEVNTENVNTHWVHSYRMEHAEHFLAPMEMYMDDHHTQTTEKTQRQHPQDIGHAEFPPGMESTPVFPGNQFQQGNEKIMDTGTFTLGNTILNRYPALSTHTHQGMENSNIEAFSCFNYYADATPQMETSRKGPGADSTPSGEDTTVTTSQVTPMDPMDDIQLPTRKCILSVHFQDSLSNKSDWLLKSKVQGNQLTGHSHQFNTDSCCDEKRNDRDLHRNWNDREQLSNTTLNTTSMTTIQAH